MSLVNDMLRDLEARKAPERSAPVRAEVHQIIEPQPKANPLNRLIVLGVFAFMMLGALIYKLVNAPADPSGQLISNDAAATVENTPTETVKPTSTEVLSATPDLNQSVAKENVEKSDITNEARSSEAEPIITASNDTAINEAGSNEAGPKNASVIEKTEEIEKAPKTESVDVASSEAVVMETKTEKLAATESSQHQQATKANIVETKNVVEPKKISKSQADNVVVTRIHRSSESQVTAQRPPTAELKTSAVANEQVVAKKISEETIQAEELKAEKAESAEEPAAQSMALSKKVVDENNADQALALYRQGRTQEAYSKLNDFMATNSVDNYSRAALANLLMRENRLAEAGDVLVALPIDEKAEWRQLKARWWMAQGKTDIAIYALTSNLPELSSHPDYFADLASYYFQQGDTKKALAIYKSLVRIDDKQANWWAGLALSLDRNQEFADAHQAYQRALGLPGLKLQVARFITKREQELSKSFAPNS